MTLQVPSKPLILTGEMQIGKSTFVRQLIEEAGRGNPAGFYTRRIQGEDQPAGHALCSWSGTCHHFSSLKKVSSGFPFQVEHDVFEEFGVEQLRQAALASWYVLDELGIMEQGCGRFETALRQLAQSGRPGIIVIQQRALNYWRVVLDNEPWQPIVLEQETDRPQLLKQMVAIL